MWKHFWHGTSRCTVLISLPAGDWAVNIKGIMPAAAAHMSNMAAPEIAFLSCWLCAAATAEASGLSKDC